MVDGTYICIYTYVLHVKDTIHHICNKPMFKHQKSHYHHMTCDNITTGFQPVPLQLIDIISCQVKAEPVQPTSPKIERPEFGPRPDTDSTDFDLKTEVDWLSFRLNIGKRSQFDTRTTELLHKSIL